MMQPRLKKTKERDELFWGRPTAKARNKTEAQVALPIGCGQQASTLVAMRKFFIVDLSASFINF